MKLEELDERRSDVAASPPQIDSLTTIDASEQDASDVAAANEGEAQRIGRYKILKQVGTGGMGVVYAAFDPRRGETVALKTLHHLDPSALYRLKNEFRSAANLDHRNLVSLHELAEHRGRWLMTMEFVAGERFTDYVRRSVDEAPARSPDAPTVEVDENAITRRMIRVDEDGEFPARALTILDGERLRAALRQLVEGVSALHEAGILHRDIKSSNVLVTRAGRVVLLDFGLASDTLHRMIDMTVEDGILGTPGFMAPEQAAGAPATEACDWYSVGVMLYEALTGELPFMGTALKILTTKQMEDPRPPAQLAPDAPPDLAALCMELLRREPHRRPQGAEIRARLRGDSADTPRPRVHAITVSEAHALRVPFVGRERQLEALHAAFQDVDRRDAPITVEVRGRSGIGKTALIERFLAQLRQVHASGRAVILSGRCYERESVPYKAFDSLVDALTRYLRRLPRVEAAGLMPRDIHELARVFPVLERVPAVSEVPRRAFAVPDHQEVQRRAFKALKELLARISDRYPLVLHIGDLQWGDEDSARLLVELLSPPEPPSLLLLTTYRDLASADASLVMLRRLAELRDQSQPSNRPERRVIELGPLTPADAERLAAARLEQQRARVSDTSPVAPAELREQARVIARESDGSPLFVEELVRHATRPRDAAPDTEDAPPVELSLERVVRERLAQLDPDARQLIHVLAVASRPLPGPLALAAAGLDLTRRGLIDTLRAHQLIRVHGARPEVSIECYHDRIRETVLAQLDHDTLRACHRALATALERAPQPDLGTIAHHLYGAGAIEAAAQRALAAAEQAVAAVAFNRAAQLYELAARWDPRDPDHARALRVKQADALAHAGRCADAAPLYEEMALEAPADEAVELRRAAAEQFLVSGHIDDGIRILRPLLAEVGLDYPKTPDHANAAIIRATTQLSLRGIGYQARERDSCRLEDLQRVDVCWSAGKGLGFVDPIRGYSFYLRSLLLALQLGTPGRIARSLASVGMVMMSRGTEHSITRGTSFIREAERIARERDDPYLLGFTDVIAGTASLTLGRWRAALERLDQGVQLLQDRCVGVAWERDVAQMASLRALLMMGEVESLASRASAWERMSERTGDVNGAVWAGLFRALPLLARDRPAELREHIRVALTRWTRDGFHFQHLLALVMLSYCDIYEGQPRAAHERFEAAWGEVENSRILSWQFLRIFGLQARASAAIAAARSTASSRQVERLLAKALCYAHDLELGGASRHDQTAAVSLIRAGVASCRRQQVAALSHLDAAARDFDAADMKLHAACARRRRGQLIGGALGQKEVDAADVYIARLGVRRPERWANIYAPGFAFLTTPRVRQ